MCGIFCCISKSQKHNCLDQIEELLKNRGPNRQHEIRLNNLLFAGFVLWQQGKTIFKQPVVSEGHILLFNGDVYNSEEELVRSDTEWIFEKFSQTSTEDEFIKCFRFVEGPFSLVFYDKQREYLYFARDSLGRNSLLLESSADHIRLLSTSCICENVTTTMELPPLGVYRINMQDIGTCHVFPWETPDDYWINQSKFVESMCDLRIIPGEAIVPNWLKDSQKSNRFLFNFYDLKLDEYSSTTSLYENLLKDEQISLALDSFSYYLEHSVKKRVELTTNFCANCISNYTPCDHSKVAILFSGGIDCSILAILADKYVAKSDSIDLINVAFQPINGKEFNWNVPDRISGKCSLASLMELRPDRKWNFIEVNVTRKELHIQLASHIKHLIFPLNTVLDESIGCAFWFASKAKGKIGEKEAKSTARVVIVGSGADELFGGYVRHKNAYNRCPGTHDDKDRCLHKELEMDWKRIPARNLARDDRVISDTGKTARAPFIEENVVKFVRSMTSNQRCCFLFEDGIGDKLFLRLYGYRLGLKSSAFLKKRAIQFGSKIANKKQNATDRSAYMVFNLIYTFETITAMIYLQCSQ